MTGRALSWSSSAKRADGWGHVGCSSDAAGVPPNLSISQAGPSWFTPPPALVEPDRLAIREPIPAVGNDAGGVSQTRGAPAPPAPAAMSPDSRIRADGLGIS
jgi:hypothetical protein